MRLILTLALIALSTSAFAAEIPTFTLSCEGQRVIESGKPTGPRDSGVVNYAPLYTQPVVTYISDDDGNWGPMDCNPIASNEKQVEYSCSGDLDNAKLILPAYIPPFDVTRGSFPVQLQWLTAKGYQAPSTIKCVRTK